MGPGEFLFDPPVRLKRDVTIRTLEQAAAFVRRITEPRFPSGRATILRCLETATRDRHERQAANAFRGWAKAEGLLED
jgi:hypothetical protein